MNEKTKAIPQATTVRELSLPDFGHVHGVTCDASGNVWFAHGEGDLVCVEPKNGRVLRRFDDIGATSGTAFDGTHLWQIAGDRVVRMNPQTGAVVHSIPTPLGVHCSGMAWMPGGVRGALWIGSFQGRELVKVDAETGAELKRLATDRLVTGVEWIDGELWHGAWKSEEEPVGAELRRVDPDSGRVEAELRMPDDFAVSGVGADREGRLWCGGSFGGGIRAVRRP
jgi:streptogramin lyase